MPQPPAGRLPVDVEMIRESIARSRGVLSPARILPPDVQLDHLDGLLRGHIRLLIERVRDQADADGPGWPRTLVAVTSARVALDHPAPGTGALHSAVTVHNLGDACDVLLTVYTEAERQGTP
jgi:hypothetical protein